MAPKRPPFVEVDDLTAGYHAWPVPEHDKTKLRALVLRVRIERLVAALPTTVIAAAGEPRQVGRRLQLSVGDPGLDVADQRRRHRVVTAAVMAYNAICDLLHGRNPDPNPPLPDVSAWAAAVDALESELSR
jgi:hypothetical protein